MVIHKVKRISIPTKGYCLLILLAVVLPTVLVLALSESQASPLGFVSSTTSPHLHPRKSPSIFCIVRQDLLALMQQQLVVLYSIVQ